MKTVWIVLIVIGVFIAISLMSIIGKYNGLVSQQESVTSGWAQVENVYQRRADLIPNLVSTVKGYASHEKETLEAVIEARSKATKTTIDPSNMSQEQLNAFQANQGGLGSALSKLMLVMERYPDLKANQGFLDLQAQLEGSENRISVERKRYNDLAEIYNISRRKFPTIIVANMFGFDEKPYFAADDGADTVPTVEF